MLDAFGFYWLIDRGFNHGFERMINRGGATPQRAT